MPAKLLQFFIFLLSLYSVANAEEKRPDVGETATKSLDLTWEASQQRPSQELLEFLADWETMDGEWISPQEVKELDIPENPNETIRER